MSEPSYDLIIIGAGPGGYVAAIRAAQLGMRVAVVEREHLGGVCLNWGCIPTKALLRNAEVIGLLDAGKEFGFSVENVQVDFGAAIDRSRKIAERLVKGVKLLMEGNGIDVIWGSGRLASATAVEVTTPEGDVRTLSAGAVILATGSHAVTIPGVAVDGKQILTAREALARRDLPQSAVIVGAGPIGLEFAAVWSAYGTQVTVVEMLDRILPTEDEEATAELARALKRQKVKVRTSTRVAAIEKQPESVRVQVEGPKGAETLEADVVLMAIGVRPNSADVGLEDAGVETDRGWVKVDGWMRTSVPGVYAIGDLNGLLPLAHVASAQGILAVETIAGMETEPFDVRGMPRGTYTTPQVVSFGISEAEARARGLAVRVGKVPFLFNGKALGRGENGGFVKVVASEENGEILGAVIVGPEASELLPELLVAYTAGLTPEAVAGTVHAHPTLNETVMEAAHAAFGKAIHAAP